MRIGTENGSNSRGNSPSLAVMLSQLAWGGANSALFPAYQGACDASAATTTTNATAAPAGGNGTPAAGAGSPPAAGPTTPAPSTGTPTTGAPAAGGAPPVIPNPNDEHLRTLRTNYEKLKPWEQAASTIKDPASALTAHQTVTKLHDNGLQMAKSLGYTPESFEEAFKDDPVDTLARLRQEHAQANPDAAANERIRRAAEEAARTATKPIHDQLNRQQTETAMNRFQGEFDRLLADDKIGFGNDVPEELKSAMFDMVDSLLPDNVLVELKSQGKVSGIQAVFDQAKTRLIKVVSAYNTMMAKTAAPATNAGAGRFGPRQAAAAPAGNNGNQPTKGLTLDDIMNDPDKHLPGLAKGAY